MTAGTTSLARHVGEGIYTDPRAAFRELVDRAADACARRLAIDPDHGPSILVSTQTIGGVAHVSVTDNGEAFEADAFRALYQVIQSGRLGAVKRALARDGAADVVGTFGASLLAAFLLADRIVITARHHGSAATEAVRFTCDSRTYQLEACTAARAGSTVQLRVRHHLQKLATIDAIRETLADVPYPIRIGL